MGGLGLRSTRDNNISLLGKLVDSLLHDKDKIWVKALSEKYLANDSVLVANYKYGDSYIWKGIIQAKNNIAAGFGAQLGSGTSSFWYDKWLGSGKLCLRVPFVHISDTAFTVADMWENGTWALSKLYTLLAPNICNEISDVPVPGLRQGSDELRWKSSPNGCYSTSSAYNLVAGIGDDGSAFWKHIWKAKVPEKLRFFLWLVGKGSLPTNAKRERSHLSNFATCSRCSAVIEDENHVFRECPQSKQLWQYFGALLPPLNCHIAF